MASDDDKKKLIAGQATSDLFETLQRATEAVRAVSALGSKILQPSFDIQEKLFGASRRIQQQFTAPFLEISKLMSTDPLRDTFERISRAMAVWEELLPILDEIDRQNQLAADELPRISAKLNTVPDKGYTIQDVESSILRLEKIEEICLQIISELKNGVQFYNELETGVDCSEELESLANNLKDVQQHHARCLELLTTKRVQLDFIVEADAEYHSRPKPKSAEEECDIFLPDYVLGFSEMERTLARHKYIDNDGHWIADKQTLASFIQQLYDCRYFKRNRASTSVWRRTIREFFERRYRIDITEQFKPSKVGSHPLSPLFPVDLTKK